MTKYVPIAEGDIVVLSSAAFNDRYLIARILKVTQHQALIAPWNPAIKDFDTEHARRRDRLSILGLYKRDESLSLSDDLDRTYDRFKEGVLRMAALREAAKQELTDLVNSHVVSPEDAV